LDFSKLEAGGGGGPAPLVIFSLLSAETALGGGGPTTPLVPPGGPEGRLVSVALGGISATQAAWRYTDLWASLRPCSLSAELFRGEVTLAGSFLRTGPGGPVALLVLLRTPRVARAAGIVCVEPGGMASLRMAAALELE